MLPPLPNFLPLAMMDKTMYNIVYIEQFDCRYIADRHGVIHIVVERKHMQDIENDSIQLFKIKKFE